MTTEATSIQVVDKDLPFALNTVAEEIGISKGSIQNYLTRGVPKNKILPLKQALSTQLNQRIELLTKTLQTIANLSKLEWDVVTSNEQITYNDYVYDFVVPEGHTFIGGALPTVMHNTQIGHILACSIQKEFPGSIAVYIDTENTFRPERIMQLAPAFDLDPEEALRSIKVAKAYNSDHQMLLAEKVEDVIKEGNNVKLVIVDSLTAHFRAEFVGRGTLAERQQKLNKHMHVLGKLADMHNLCVFVTNQVMSKPDAFFGDPTAAIGGHIVAHKSAFRIYLRKGRKGSRVAKLIDAPNLPDGECAFFIREEGLEDIEL